MPCTSEVDYYKLAREILVQLRGEMSQRSLSEKLGYSYNQVGKWESGFTQIKWDGFVAVAKALGIPLESRLSYFFSDYEGEFDVETIVAMLRNNLALDFNTDEALKGWLRKWKAKKFAPDLAEILRILDSRPAMLFSWLMMFVDGTQLMSIKEDYQAFMVRLEATMDDPNVIYVNAALRTQDYASLKVHDESLLAQHACCSIDRLRQTLWLMVSQGVVHFDGKKYEPCLFDFSFSTLRHAGLRQFTKYTTELAAEKYPVDPGSIDRSKIKNACGSSARVTAMSAKAADQVAQLVNKFHSEVGEIVKRDSAPKEHVQIIVLHNFVSNISKLPNS